MPASPDTLILQWYDHNRRDLPWRRIRDPYRIWLSEIMLQQTQVETVKGYYRRFLDLFPTVYDLASAPEELVLKAWEGLGYYSRARNLHKAAQQVVESHNGVFPTASTDLLHLPGVGAYTSGAVASIAFNERVPAVDGNVYRVISRFFGVRENIGSPKTQKKIYLLTLGSMPQDRPGDYNQALMELGATLCSPASPRCDECPWAEHCDAFAQGDMTLLPIHEKKRPQRMIPVAVCLLTCNGQILTVKRRERMLQGLYVFNLIEEETTPERAREALQAQGLSCTFHEALGTARHVFTHRIWEMELLHFILRSVPADDVLQAIEAKLVTASELDALPMPTAMHAARKAAASLIG